MDFAAFTGRSVMSVGRASSVDVIGQKSSWLYTFMK